MTISVIIPLYNKKQTILRAIESVVNQSFQDFKICVVDDGSTDGGVNLVEGLGDERISIIKQKNQGVSSARNNGVKAVSTVWVAFLDGDDEYHPDFLARMVAIIEDQKGMNLSFAGSSYENRARKKILETTSSSGLVDFYSLFEGSRSPVNSSSIVVKREHFQSVGGFVYGQTQFEDWTLYFKLAAVGGFYFLNEPLSVYHDDCRLGSATTDIAKLYQNASVLTAELNKLNKSNRLAPDIVVSCGSAVNRYIVCMGLTLVSLDQKNLAAKFVAENLMRMSWSTKGCINYLFRLTVKLLLPARLIQGTKQFRSSSRRTD